MEISRVLEAAGMKRGERAISARPVDLGEAYDMYAAPLYRYLITLLGSEEDAEDALQEIFLAVGRLGLKRIRNIQAYLFQSARRQAISLLRKRRRRSQEPEVAARLSWIDTDACSVEDRALAIDIGRALHALPAEQREVIVLHVAEGFSFREIDRLCGIPVNTAASRYRLALEKLRLALEGDAP